MTDEEETETDWEGVLKIDKASETVKSICEVTDCLNVEVQSCSRIGMWKSDKIRPIKVQLRTSSDVDLLLRRACKLKSSEEFSGVYLAPDRTLEQRAARNKLVQHMKELIIKDSSKHYLPCEPIYRLSKTCYSHIFVVLRHLFSYYITLFVLFSQFLPYYITLLILYSQLQPYYLTLLPNK